MQEEVTMENNAHPAGPDVIANARDVATRVLPMDPERIDAMAEQVRDLDRRARAFVREHPTTTVVAAVAVGFLIGRILRS
jgi:ElaB/YqjD/DUF883 family membrane-anchored ribosome-binding protein